MVLQYIPSRGSFINFLRLATDGFTNIVHTEGVTQHGAHVTTLFQASAMFCAFTLFSATGSQVCDTGMTQTPTTNSKVSPCIYHKLYPEAIPLPPVKWART
jgi:hypothetical protein